MCGFYVISETNPFESCLSLLRCKCNIFVFAMVETNLNYFEKKKEEAEIQPQLTLDCYFDLQKKKLNRYHFSNQTLVLISLSLSLLCQFTRMEGAMQHRSDGMSLHSTEATSHTRKACRLWTVSCLSEVYSIWHNNCCSVTMKSFYQVVEYFVVAYALTSRLKKKNKKKNK